IGVLAHLLGRSIVDVWTGLVGLAGERLFASEGTEVEVAHDAALLAESPVMTIDVVALLSFAHLGLLDRLAHAFDRLVSAQSTVDHIRLHYLRHFTGATPSGILGKQGSQYVRSEITHEDIDKGRDFMEGILQFLEQRTEVTPVTAALQLDPGEYGRMQGTLGSASA